MNMEFRKPITAIKNWVIPKAKTWIPPLVILLLFGYSVYLAFFRGISSKNFEVVANTSPADSRNLVLWGRVHYGGMPVRGALVWAELKDSRGNKGSSGTAVTDGLGAFKIDSVPRFIGRDTVIEVKIYAAGRVNGKNQASTKVLSLAQKGSIQVFEVSLKPLLFFIAILLCNFVVAFLPIFSPQSKYWFSILFAFALTTAMIGTIAYGLSVVNVTVEKNEVISFGFASIFQGNYVDSTQNEWILELNSYPDLRSTLTAPGRLASGFGVPLWVLFISVLGAGLLTVSIIVKEIAQGPDFEKLKDKQNQTEWGTFNKKIELLIRHQFLLLFSPLSSIFVYQTLVMGDAAAKPATVALAALGAGAALTVLLDKAVTYVQGFIGNKDKPPERPPGLIATRG